MDTDVKSAYLTATGNFQNDNSTPVNIIAARIVGIRGTGTGTCTFTDSIGAGGITRITVQFAGPDYMIIPHGGVRFFTGIYLNIGAATSVTIFYA